MVEKCCGEVLWRSVAEKCCVFSKRSFQTVKFGFGGCFFLLRF